MNSISAGSMSKGTIWLEGMGFEVIQKLDMQQASFRAQVII